MTHRNAKSEHGFTLPELLVAGAVMLIFVGVLLIAIRPNDYGTERRNAERRLELAHMMQAIARYESVKGILPPSIPADETPIASDEEGGLGLCADLVPAYLTDLPYDPASTTLLSQEKCNARDQFYLTGYMMRLENGRVVLTAPAAESDERITVERRFSIL